MSRVEEVLTNKNMSTYSLGSNLSIVYKTKDYGIKVDLYLNEMLYVLLNMSTLVWFDFQTNLKRNISPDILGQSHWVDERI